MKIKFAVSFTDGTSQMLAVDQPPGAHPGSVAMGLAVINEAEKTGKTVLRIARPVVFEGVILDTEVATREQIMSAQKLAVWPPKPQPT
jgi:hypothetical protein